MTTHTHLGHIFHIAGEPKVTEAAAALVSIPDGALVQKCDPIEYIRRLRFHRTIKSPSEYGLK